MKSKISLLLLSAGLVGSALVAQEPTVVAEHPAVASPAAPAPAPDRIVYAPRLPTPAELSNIANAQGQTIERIDETPAQVSVTTHSADGHRVTVMYCLLASSGNTPAPGSTTTYTTTTQPAAQTVVVHQSQPDVVYVNSGPGYYYPPYYYNPWSYWGPVALSVGIGYSWGYYGHSHGGYYGGYHGHGGYYGGGGHHH